eukprot:gene7231-biopygen5365
MFYFALVMSYSGRTHTPQRRAVCELMQHRRRVIILGGLAGAAAVRAEYRALHTYRCRRRWQAARPRRGRTIRLLLQEV